MKKGDGMVQGDDNLDRMRLSRRMLLRLGGIGAGSALAGSLLAACGGSSSNTPTTSGSTGAGAAPTTASAGGATAAASPTQVNLSAAPPTTSSAPATPAATKAAVKPKPLVIGFHQDPTSLDLYTNTTAAFQSVTAATNEQLVVFGSSSAKIEPWLATGWNWVDPQTLELKLRDGVKFTNGEPFDAEAARYSIDLLMKAKPYSSYTRDMDSVEAVDKTTVRVKMKVPTVSGFTALARGGYMYPPKYHAQVGPEKFGTAPIGTGPYKFMSWQKGSTIEFDPNPDYWGGTPKLSHVTFRIIPEEAARVAALQAGEVQIITNLSTASADRIKADSKLKWISRQGLRQFASFFDELMDHPIKDKKVRQALQYAVDKNALVKLFGGEATLLQGQWLTPSVLGFNPDLKAFEYDPKKAKSMLAEAGYPNGFETTFTYTINRYALDKEMGEAVASYLEAVGLKVQQQPWDYGKFQPTFHEGPGKMGPMFQWGLLSPPDPDLTLGTYAKGSDYRRFPDNPQVDQLLADGVRETDPDKRAKIYQQLVALWYDDPFGIYLIVPNDLYAASASVEGFQPRADQVLWLFDISIK